MEDKTMKMTNTNGLLVFQEVQNPANIYGCDFSGVNVVGRSAESCNIIISNPTVSRNHFKVYQQGTVCMIEDLNSTHHTFVNGNQVVVPTPIKVGDIVALGSLQLQVIQMDLSFDKMAPVQNSSMTPVVQPEPVYQPEPNYNSEPVYQPEPNYQSGPVYQPEPNYDSQGSSFNDKPQGGSGFAIASMVLGIIGLVLGCCFWYVGLPCALIGLILGIVALVKKTNGKGMAIAGVVCSIIALIPVVLTLVLGGSILAMAGLAT